MRILLNQFRNPGPTELDECRRAVVVLRDWASFSDRRVADVLGCRKATVRRLAADQPRAVHRTLSSVKRRVAACSAVAVLGVTLLAVGGGLRRSA